MTRRLAVAALAATTAIALAACSSDDADTSAAPGGDGYPVTIANTFGETTIDAKPETITTLGWNAEDIVYALGETPAAMPRHSYGAEENGVMPWLQDRYDPSATTLLDTENSTPVEAIAAVGPDVILAPYEGFDQDTYDKLSALAPTVAYPGDAWQTSWQEQTEIVGEALGKSDEAAELVRGLDDTLARTAAEHPEFEGRTISVIDVSQPGTVNVYMPTDARVQLLTSLGFTLAPGVQALADAAEDKTFFTEISAENVSDVDADVVIAFSTTGTDPTTSPALAGLGATERGGLVPMTDTKIVAGLSQSSVLATPWVLEQITPMLSEAAQR
ncbi:iron-siderophore ABC transporter substrate-binding protein [Rhodococcus rhodnii]|uniref:ABC Fe(3+) transporter n=3 Tax=Rhodococcus rhodnii TaxID=38312 RepID=R7WI46_9NOCA|nr:iron-siderophore ABC transporter substrate-binding protein [Rhodococcus rhodnii]EOM74830.1 ABC Fe(3+) transporter [Rhodococcus rhodnii LMG 5362]TXG90956.1 iron-siderophore ABC transporter substrate-binding protein [Rhodococcus rhodnii]